MVPRGLSAENKKRVDQYKIFNRPDVIAEGWYWLMRSRDLQRGSVQATAIFGRELAVFRDADGKVAALDAYCPHMGAHLAEGNVEGNQLRCFFHNWRFNNNGECTDIPCMRTWARPKAVNRIKARTHATREKYGFIWIWIGSGEPTEEVPVPPELVDSEYEFSVGKRFTKNCHPNVVMINAIDEHHFQTVHNLPGNILSMEPKPVSSSQLKFSNTGRVPTSSLVGRLLSRFYEKNLTYELDYCYGCLGIVTVGPDFLHLYLMFILKLTDEGTTEGYAIALTRKRKTVFGAIFNRLLLPATQLAGLYFAAGDTRVFRSIKFNLANPVPADRAVLAFIQHLDEQVPVHREERELC